MRKSQRVLRSSVLTAALAIIAIVLIFASARPARSAVTTTTVETFDGSIGDATWRVDNYFSTNDVIESSGGHPGAFLHNPSDLSTGPTAHYAGPANTAFVGDYRAANVTSLGIDVNIFSGEVDHGGGYPWKLGLTLMSGTETEYNEYDDCRVSTAGAMLPMPGSGWKSFTFKVASGRASLPAGWVMEGPCNNLSQDEAWNYLITHVSDALFSMWGGQYAIYRTWDVGIDSVTITSRTNGSAVPAVPDWTMVP